MTNLTQSMTIIDQLLHLGSTRFVISPGSRSTPLTVAAARNPGITTTVHYDERGAAFFALGHAKATGKPAVLICTSGTAVANYFPAIIEASMDNIPLIVLSADRPPELIDVGANQAIFQENIYGSYPRLALNLPPPEADSASEETLSIVEDIYSAATEGRPGPVHLNCQFREPLLPETDVLPADREIYLGPEKRLDSTSPIMPQTQIDLINEKLNAVSKGLIVVGRSVSSLHDEVILEMATSLGWPIFPDIQSKLRFSHHPNLIPHYDLGLLRSEASIQSPEMVIHLGGAFTSKRLLQFLDNEDIYYLSIKETSERIDPNHQLDLAIQADPSAFCHSLQVNDGSTDPEWLAFWQKSESKIAQAIDHEFESNQELSEPSVSFHLSKLAPEKSSLMLANSMSIREMEMFASANPGLVRVFANRGASGIDGLLATAAGFSSANPHPLTLLIGDLAFLHDLNSLALIKHSAAPIIVVLINNNGGGIFNFLPVKSEHDVFEPYFGTPHNLTFKQAAQLFGLNYEHPGNSTEFLAIYKRQLKP